MLNMRYISEVPAGYLVRKAVNGKLFQSFFGETRYGTSEEALVAAIEYRDNLIEKVGGTRSFQHQNIRNVTGIVGVAWHCRPNTHRNGTIVHFFRAQVSNENGKAISKSWSIQKHGLWPAYRDAAYWRNEVAFKKLPSLAEIEQEFLNFLDFYVDELDSKTHSPEAVIEMKFALSNMAARGIMPKGAFELLPTDIYERFSQQYDQDIAEAKQSRREWYTLTPR